MVLLKRICTLLLIVLICSLLAGYIVGIPAFRRGIIHIYNLADRRHSKNSESSTSTLEGRLRPKELSQLTPLESTEPIYTPDKFINMLRLEIARLNEICSRVQQKIREDDIHIQLLKNRGYGMDSPEVIQRANEKCVHQSELAEANEEVLELEKRLHQVELAIKDKKEREYPHASNRMLDCEWYMWLQNSGRDNENLLQLGP